MYDFVHECFSGSDARILRITLHLHFAGCINTNAHIRRRFELVVGSFNLDTHNLFESISETIATVETNQNVHSNYVSIVYAATSQNKKNRRALNLKCLPDIICTEDHIC